MSRKNAVAALNAAVRILAVPKPYTGVAIEPVPPTDEEIHRYAFAVAVIETPPEKTARREEKRLRNALSRLASSEAFSSDTVMTEETRVRARMAEAALVAIPRD
jgi:hypothetical protein